MFLTVFKLFYFDYATLTYLAYMKQIFYHFLQLYNVALSINMFEKVERVNETKFTELQFHFLLYLVKFIRHF
ncbi:hypothetical protein VIMY103929_04005 [Vibrio mytili]